MAEDPKGHNLGLPEPALKSLIDAFKTIEETFSDMLQEQQARRGHKSAARQKREVVAKPTPGEAPV